MLTRSAARYIILCRGENFSSPLALSSCGMWILTLNLFAAGSRVLQWTGFDMYTQLIKKVVFGYLEEFLLLTLAKVVKHVVGQFRDTKKLMRVNETKNR